LYQRLYHANELDPFFENTPLHCSTSAGETSPALTRELTQTLDNLTCPEQNKMGKIAAVLAEMKELGLLSTKLCILLCG